MRIDEVAEAADITACAQIIADVISSNSRIYDEVAERVTEYCMDIVPASSENPEDDNDEGMEQSRLDLETLVDTLIQATLKKIERL